MPPSDAANEIMELAKVPAHIRNICTSAHIHHGKCIDGKSRLILANGEIKTAEQIYQLAEQKGQKFEEKEEHTIYDISKENITIFSLNQATGQLEKKNVSLAWKLKGGQVIKIKLRNGFDITSTPEHKYIVFKNMQFVEKIAGELRLGDNIVCARKTNVDANIDLKKEMLELLRNKNFYVCLKEDFVAQLKQKIFAYGTEKLVKEINSPIKPKSFYHGIWQKRILLNDLLNACKIFDITEIYDKIETIVYRTGKQRGHNSLPIKLPQNFANFFYLAGLFTGDGSSKRFIVGKEELRKEFISICQEIGCNATEKNDKGKTPALETNKTLLHMLNTIFDYPLKQKSHNVKISTFVWKSPKELIGKFLKGYFDTDGTVELSRGAISIYSASKQMMKDLPLLLLRFGIVPIVNNDNIYISGFSVEQYNKQIGFNVKHKEQRAKALATNAIGSYVTDWINLTTETRVSKHNTQKLVQLGLKEQVQNKFFNDDLVYIQVTGIEEGYEETVYDFTVPDNHTFIAEGIVMHNTALTDNLLAASGHISSKAAGDLDKGMATWQHADEQERLMTVDAANVSMIHTFENTKYLINLIDTPGHVDFGGNVTRAMRAIDGTIVLICAVEGIMPQTETVVRQAIRERVKPVLFINKVDRLINELKFTPEQMQERFLKLITEFNTLIENTAEDEYKQKWKVDILNGSVAFGSARENWALSIPYMKNKNVSFKDIVNLYKEDVTEENRQKWIWEKAPVFEVILDMVIKHLPNPLEAQKYRIPHIWHGDLETQFGKDLLVGNPNGKIAFVITRITIDPRFGRELCAGRLFSGTVRAGQTVWLNNAKSTQRIAQVFMYKGIKPESLDSVSAGNVLALGGISGMAGETITEGPEQPFEELKHIFEPVITKSIEPLKPQDLPKLVEVLKKVLKEDPSIKIDINQETGENLIHGMGELHLEIIENRIKTEKGLDIKTSPPIVVYRESMQKPGQEMEGKSPNKHNKFYIVCEPLEENVHAAIKKGDIPEGRVSKKDTRLYEVLEKLGWSAKEAKKVRDVYNGNLLIDDTRGIVYIGEVQELINDGYEQVMKQGPIAREPVVKLKVIVKDCKLHEDAIHRGPAQVVPAIREAIRGSMNSGNAIIYEPLQVLQIDAPADYMGEISKLVQNKRGQLLSVKQEGTSMSIRAKLPVAESFGLASDLRSATAGRGSYFLVDQMYEKLPSDLQPRVAQRIRERKGLKAEEPVATE